MGKLKTAVIGVGYLGKFHAEKYAASDMCDFIAVVDIDKKLALDIASRHQVKGLSDYRELIGKVDAVSIVTPTTLHHEIALDFLNNGCHVLIEKPITVSLEEADELIALAQKNKLIIQVGHLERFNAAILELDKHIKSPNFIESNRLSPFNTRATDVNVVLDLMIHDIDIILNIVDADIKSIQVSGTNVLTDNTDIANARLEFSNGCVANVTASRVSQKTERKLRLFQDDAYISVDFNDRTLKKVTKGQAEMHPGIPDIVNEQYQFDDNDALNLEIIAFMDSIINGTPVRVSGIDGRRALDAAIQITDLLNDQQSGH